MTGQSIAHYEIVEKIGEGGMGVVYRARDTKLGRDVALKVLPEQFARDPQRMGRFEREARALASLNHPNIASIHGLEEQNGVHALVMELVEGPTLADRIDQGAIPLDEALPLARQIADAVEYAHEHGVIHRDLKPANVKVTEDGNVKVLDFGLAKAMTDESRESDPENSPTLTIGATKAGVILGTAAYMSPEQARGRKVDKRADIWAFGVVLYEMVTGQRLFRGEDLTDTLAMVVREQPDLSAAPAKVRRLLTRCLERDPKKRLRDISVAWELIEDEPLPDGRGSERSRYGWLPWAVAAVALVVALVLGIGRRGGPPPEDRPLVRVNLDLPGYTGANPYGAALSDDGSRIAYVTTGPDGVGRLATRLLSEPDAHVLAGTEDAHGPVFSPDGRWIAFGAQNRLKKVSVQGGTPLDLAAAPAYLGVAWSPDGSLIASLNLFSGLVRIPESGGEPQPIKGVGTTVLGPQVLPGGDAVLFSETTDVESRVRLLRLATGQVTTLVTGGSIARFFPAGGPSRGHLVYLNNGTLFAAPFDAAAGEISGQPVPMLENVTAYVASASGSLLYQSGAVSDDWPVDWMRQDGTTEPLIPKRADYQNPELSPDGRLLALNVDNAQDATRRVIVYDWQNNVTVPLTQPGEAANEPVWSPDSKYLAFRIEKDGKPRLVWKRADGTRPEHPLLEGDEYIAVTSISPDGKHMAFMRAIPNRYPDLWEAPLDLSNPDEPVVGEPEPLVRSTGLDYGLVFSPDGRWVAYASDRGGAWKVYVQPFPGPGEPREIAPGGWPNWSSNGKQLFLLVGGLEAKICSVDYQVQGDAFVAGQPRLWSETPIRMQITGPSYALDPDGQRVIMFPVGADGPEQAAALRFGFLLNFSDELRRRAPLD